MTNGLRLRRMSLGFVPKKREAASAGRTFQVAEIRIFDKLESVMAMGYAVNTFTLVRLYFKIELVIGMDYEMAYDRSLIFACMSNFPIAIGPLGCMQLVFAIFLWNALLNILQPGMRDLLQVNRSVADVFPDKFNGKPVDFAGELKKFAKLYDKEWLVVAHAAFHVIAGSDDKIQVDEVVQLFEGWGLPDAKRVAHEVFSRSDENHDGVIDFDEFSRHLSFIWERISYVGEAEHDTGGKLHPILLEDTKVKKAT